MTSGNLQLKKLKIGKVDGKHEYLTPISQREKDAFDAFLVPSSVDVSRFGNNDVIFVEGFRGTGKTSLLRWYAEKETRLGAVTDFVLFKSDLTESQRAHISSEIGISWTDIDAKSMEFSQDFKAAWIWFIIHKIGESLKQYPDLVDSKTTSIANNAVRLLGLNDDGIFQKAIGFMPKLEGAHVKVRADVKFFEAELAGDFRPDGNHGKITLDTLSKKVSWLISKLKLNKKLIICFDELEAFYHSDEQHKRDQRMVRDLLFSVSSLNDTFRKSGTAIHILAAVRSEVISSMGSLGQEIGRLVHDKGFLINWYHAKRSAQHPLMQIIRKKIQASERLEGKAESQDPIKEYFVGHVNGSNIESFLLDKSFYKPRDIVWRLSLAQVLFPEETKFTEEVLHQTEIMYSENYGKKYVMN